jgi:hypothetical protein
MCRVLSIKEDGKVDVSLRESVVKRGILAKEEIKVDLVVKGTIISKISEFKYLV